MLICFGFNPANVQKKTPPLPIYFRKNHAATRKRPLGGKYTTSLERSLVE